MYNLPAFHLHVYIYFVPRLSIVYSYIYRAPVRDIIQMQSSEHPPPRYNKS